MTVTGGSAEMGSNCNAASDHHSSPFRFPLSPFMHASDDAAGPNLEHSTSLDDLKKKHCGDASQSPGVVLL
jgi:hypothetical protein